MAHEPKVHSIAFVALATGMLAFSIVFAFVSIAVLVLAPAPLLFKIAWIAMNGGFIVLGAWLVLKAWQFHRAPIERLVAMVVRTRTEISSGGRDASTSTTYFVTLQSRDGARTELRAPGPVMGQLAADDIGIAYRKAATLVDFRRFAV